MIECAPLIIEGLNELANQRKSPPFEGGEAAPTKRERESAKHQEKAQTGWFLQSTDHLNHPACSHSSQAPLLQKEGIFGFPMRSLSAVAQRSKVLIRSDNPLRNFVRSATVLLVFGNE
jgi:hypothetical protein